MYSYARINLYVCRDLPCQSSLRISVPHELTLSSHTVSIIANFILIYLCKINKTTTSTLLVYFISVSARFQNSMLDQGD